MTSPLTASRPSRTTIVCAAVCRCARAPGPIGDTLRKNVAFRNKPFGTFWDRTDRIRFKDNRCATSQPGGLCD